MSRGHAAGARDAGHEGAELGRAELSAQRGGFFLEIFFTRLFAAAFRGEGSADEEPDGNASISLKHRSGLGSNK